MAGSAVPSSATPTGPLSGIRVLELAAIGPVPHAAFVLGSLGADVVRVAAPQDRPGAFVDLTASFAREVRLDLKSDEQRADLLALVAVADVLIEGFRPGVAERLGVGPDAAHAVNPGLVYGRMSGWGQDGPWAQRAGHDINYLSVTGALEAIGPTDRPALPLNLVGDYAGGSLQLVIGVLAALVRRNATGRGEVVDAAIVDGVPVLMELVYALDGLGLWSTARESNLLDGGVPFYRTYACADGRFVAVGALEAKFYAELVAGLGLDPADLPDRDDQSAWPALTRVFQEAFVARPRDEWADGVRRNRCMRDTGARLPRGGRPPAPEGAGERHLGRRPAGQRTDAEVRRRRPGRAADRAATRLVRRRRAGRAGRGRT